MFDPKQTIQEAEAAFNNIVRFVRENAADYEAHEMERDIFKRMIMLGRQLLKYYFETKGTGDVGPEIVLEDGRILKREKTPRPRKYLSVFGMLDVHRTCYRASDVSVFPLDREANLPERRYSYFIQELAAYQGSDKTYADTSDFFRKVFGLSVQPSRLETILSDTSAHYDEFYDDPTSSPDLVEPEGELLVASFDGKCVPIAKAESAKLRSKLGSGEKRQKKKEALVGTCYTVDRKPRTAQDLAESLLEPERYRERCRREGRKPDKAKGRNILRTASVAKPKKEVMEFIQADAESRDTLRKKPVVLLMDGDLGLWRKAANLFREWSNVTRILDIIHVVQYLWLATNALFGEGSAEGRIWIKEKLTEILEGRVGYFIGGLKQRITKNGLKGSTKKALEKVITYFENHRRWMRYDEYLAAGMPIATGVVESACNSVVKNRMEGNGMRWTVDGAEAVLRLRSLKKSGHLEEFGHFRTTLEQLRLYGPDSAFKPVSAHHKAA